jgi:hypothetical protein
MHDPPLRGSGRLIYGLGKSAIAFLLEVGCTSTKGKGAALSNGYSPKYFKAI